MSEAPHRVDTWIQLAVLLLAILGGVYTLGGRLGGIEQQLRDNAALQDVQAQRIQNLEMEVIELTRRMK